MTYVFVEGGDLFSGVEVAFVITRKPGMGTPISDLDHRSSKRHRFVRFAVREGCPRVRGGDSR